MMLLSAAMQIFLLYVDLYLGFGILNFWIGVLLYFLCSQASLSSFFDPATNLIDGGKA